VAEVRGTRRSEEVIAVGAHIDSFPGTIGANDNASGCARLVEFARWFVDHPPARTVRFIWFTGEELDRRGSRAYVAAHGTDPEEMCLFVNVDGGVSCGHERFPVDVADQASVTEAVRRCLERIIDGGSARFFSRTAHRPSSSDAAPFHEAGIPAIQAPGTGRRKKPGPNPHLPTDTVDKLDQACVLTASVVALAFIDAAQKHGITIPTSPRGKSGGG
jgi:aminopeptidase YwaD